MKSSLRFLMLLCALVAGPAAAEDAEGCKDHPLFNRMPGHRLISCDSKQFDAIKFPVSKLDENQQAKTETVEGAYSELYYIADEGTTKPSLLQIIRNYQNAMKSAGGKLVMDCGEGECSETPRESVFKLTKGGREIWVRVLAISDGEYQLRMVEREAMKQDITANDLLDKINKDGFVALYINFDTGKAGIKPDSLPAIDQVAAMLKSAPELKLEIAGHTDNVGGAEANQKLSDDRAKSVVAALTQRGVDGKRLTPKGYGQSTPVADNRSEDGRAKNRRVELVKL